MDFSMNLDEVEESNFDILDDGIYELELSDVELKNNSSGSGSYVLVKLAAPEEYRNVAPIRHMFNVVHRNSEDAERIGRSQLKTFVLCCNPEIDSEIDMDALRDLVGSTVKAKVSIDDSWEYPKNTIDKFMKANGKQPSKAERELVDTTDVKETKSKGRKPRFEDGLEDDEPEEKPKKRKGRAGRKKSEGPVDYDDDDIPNF